jgi:AcrR family transcriptional regulator
MQTMDGRTRRRLTSMRHVQEVALGLFFSRGFDAVTVEDIARAADVGVASIFRNFGTKERLVLWDEYDPLLLGALEKHLEKKAPLSALNAALQDSLGEVYERDHRRVLRRSDLMAKTPALLAAARADLHSLREGLDRALKAHVADAFERELTCAVFLAALEVSVERWRKERARRPLRDVLREAFRHVARLG